MSFQQRAFDQYPDHSIRDSDGATTAVQKSYSNVFDLQAARDMDTPAFREWFTQTLSSFLKLNFASAGHVRDAFPGISFQTAVNWYEGHNRASGDSVALIMMCFPNALPFFRAKWAQDQKRG